MWVVRVECGFTLNSHSIHTQFTFNSQFSIHIQFSIHTQFTLTKVCYDDYTMLRHQFTSCLGISATVKFSWWLLCPHWCDVVASVDERPPLPCRCPFHVRFWPSWPAANRVFGIRYLLHNPQSKPSFTSRRLQWSGKSSPRRLRWPPIQTGGGTSTALAYKHMCCAFLRWYASGVKK
jgi:hypothetical protein